MNSYYQLILKFLGARQNSIDFSLLTNVSIVVSGQFTFYLLKFVTLQEKIVAINSQGEVYVVYENNQQN